MAHIDQISLTSSLQEQAVHAVNDALEDCAEAAVRFALQDEAEALDTLALKVQLEIAHATLQGVVNALVEARLLPSEQLNLAVASALRSHAATLRRRTESDETLM